jgi:kinesin family protein 6/9
MDGNVKVPSKAGAQGKGAPKEAKKSTSATTKGGKTLNQVLASDPSRRASLFAEEPASEQQQQPQTTGETKVDPIQDTQLNKVSDIQDSAALAGPKRSSAPRSRAEEFESFKKEKGFQMYQNLMENKSLLKDKKKSAKDLAQQMNSVKSEMEALKSRVDSKRAERANLESKGIKPEKQVIDEEEYAMISSIKTLRENYDSLYDHLKALRSEIDYGTHLVDQCRQKFMSEFEQWYEVLYGGQILTDTSNQGGYGIGDDVLDIGEKFDKLQMERMAQEDPDSLAFYTAKKNTERRALKV